MDPNANEWFTSWAAGLPDIFPYLVAQDPWDADIVCCFCPMVVCNSENHWELPTSFAAWPAKSTTQEEKGSEVSSSAAWPAKSTTQEETGSEVSSSAAWPAKSTTQEETGSEVHWKYISPLVIHTEPDNWPALIGIFHINTAPNRAVTVLLPTNIFMHLTLEK